MSFKEFFITIYKRISEFFNSKTHPQDHKPVVIEDNPRVDTSEEEPKDPQVGIVGIIVGHNSKNQGAINYLKETEWNFGSRIGKKVHAKLKALGYKAYVIFRPPGARYSQQVNSVKEKCIELDVTHAISVHFNSASAGARGGEFLVPRSASKIDNLMADMGTDLLNQRLGIIERREDGVYEVSPSHNGAGMLYGLHEVGIHAVIAEPCFANYRTPESAAIFENEDAYVDILVELCIACATGKISEYNVH